MDDYERDPDEPDPDEDPDAWFDWFKEIIPVELVERLLAAVSSDDEDAGDDLRELDANWFQVAWTLALLLRGAHDGEAASVDLVDSLIQSSRDT